MTAKCCNNLHLLNFALMAAVKFHNADVNALIKEKTKLKLFISHIFVQEGKKLAYLDFIFCSDTYLLTLNQQFLQHDYFTDILTFDLSKDNSGVIGEIYISIDRVKENAKVHQTHYNIELNRVIFHGTLHLCGYLDNTQEDQIVMTDKENHYLKLYEAFHVETK